MGKTLWMSGSRQSPPPARWLVRLLCMLMVPVVMIAASSSPASADLALYGENAPGEFGTGAAQWATDCTVNGRFMVTGPEPTDITVEVRGSCYAGIAAGDTQITLLASAPGCSFTGGPVEINERMSTTTWDMQMTMGLSAPLYDHNTCVITTGSVTFCYSAQDFPWEDPDYGSNCESMEFEWPLGQPPLWDDEPATTCEYSGATLEAFRPQLADTTNTSGQARNITFDAQTSTGVPLGSSGWFIYAVLKRTGGSGTAATTSTPAVGYTWLNTVTLSAPVTPLAFLARPQDAGGFTGFPYQGNLQVFRSHTSGTYEWTIIGGGYIYVPKTGISSTNQQKTPQDAAAGAVGVTDPARCMWYWGDKVASTVADDYDEPIAPLGGPPPPEDPGPLPDPEDPGTGDDNGCDFSFTDPGSWLEGGMCMLVGLIGRVVTLLGNILGTLGNILGAIAGLVGELLEGLISLFVPSDGFLEGKLDEVKDAWADTAPFAFLDGLGGVVGALDIPAPGSDCAGPALTFTDPLSDTSNTLRPLSSCDGNMSVVAGLVKAALTVAIYVGGFLVAARVVGAAFGMTIPGLGKDEAAV